MCEGTKLKLSYGRYEQDKTYLNFCIDLGPRSHTE